MKKILLPLMLSILVGSIAKAATVSGTVSSAATCAVVSGQKVYLTDTFTYTVVDSAITNSAGVYSMTFPSGWASFNPYLVSATACSITSNAAGAYTGSNAVHNLVVCGTAKILAGRVMLGSTPNAGPARVYLVKVQRNYPIAGDTTLTAVDSVTLTATANFVFSRPCTPNDTFLVKAMLLPAHSGYSAWLPSYDSSLTWSTAIRYYGASFNGAMHNLYMFPGTNPGGPGFIGGSVLVGANKATGVGDPLAARLMILVNATTNAPVAYTYSDATGKFSFPSVATGTYKLFGDAAGLYNIPLTVTVGAANLTINNIIFEENYGENTFKGHLNTAGVGTIAGPLAGVSVYPNPASSKVSLQGMNDIRGSKTVVLCNILGATVMTKEFADGQTVELAIAGLASGTYVLQLTTSVGVASFKVVK